MGRRTAIFNRSSRTGRLVLSFLAILGCLIILLPSTVSALESKDEFLAADEYQTYSMFLMGKDDKLNVTLRITNGGPGDLYVIKSAQLTNYDNGEDFLPAAFKENVNGEVTLTWTQPDDGMYYIVVDNWDNNRSSDAYSRSNMTYDINYDYTSEDLDDLFAFLGGILIVMVVVMVIINILILVWIYKDAEKRGKSGIGWVIFALICGPIACIAWLLVRPPELGLGGMPPGMAPGMGQPGYGNYPPPGQYPPPGYDQPPPDDNYGGEPPRHPPRY